MASTWYGNSFTTAWEAWNGTTASTATSTTNHVWTYWNSTATDSATSYFQTPPGVFPSPEEQEENRRRAAEAAQRYNERKEEQRQAVRRAVALLHETLDDEQKDTLTRNGAFRVRGSKGGVFEVCQGIVYEVDEDRNRRRASVCIHARDGVPEADNMLAKKLMIETNEDEFRRIGNFSRV